MNVREPVQVVNLQRGAAGESGGQAPLRAALLGNPNCGKTALFNRLTGSRQKVANYGGVTVERKEGRCTTPAGMSVWWAISCAGVQ